MVSAVIPVFLMGQMDTTRSDLALRPRAASVLLKLLGNARAVEHSEKMADISLDEVIRQRGINLKASTKR